MEPHQAFLRDHWTALAPELLRSARHSLRMLGWAEGRSHRPAVLQDYELLNAAAVGYLSGRFSWPEGLAVTRESFLRVLCKTMFRLASEQRKRAAVARRSEGSEPDDHAAEAPTASERCHQRGLVARVEAINHGDGEALAVLAAYAEGIDKREQIAEHLGWAVVRVQAVLRRMARRRRALGLTFNDDGEPGRASPEPQGRDDDSLSAAGGRHGASAECDRGDGLAGGGR